MPNKNTSRKNTKQVEKPKAETTKEEDDWATNIVVKSNPSSRESTRSNKKGSPPERILSEWEKVGMTEEDYKSMLERVTKEIKEWQMENLRASFEAEWDSLDYWQRRLDNLERSREKYNMKRGWSAEDIHEIDQIDAQILECEEEIERIESMDSFEEEGIPSY